MAPTIGAVTVGCFNSQGSAICAIGTPQQRYGSPAIALHVALGLGAKWCVFAALFGQPVQIG